MDLSRPSPGLKYIPKKKNPITLNGLNFLMIFIGILIGLIHRLLSSAFLTCSIDWNSLCCVNSTFTHYLLINVFTWSKQAFPFCCSFSSHHGEPSASSSSAFSSHSSNWPALNSLFLHGRSNLSFLPILLSRVTTDSRSTLLALFISFPLSLSVPWTVDPPPYNLNIPICLFHSSLWEARTAVHPAVLTTDHNVT